MVHDLIEIDHGKARLHLHSGQSRVWDSTRRFNFIVAGTQSGKTTFGPWWLWREVKRCGEGDYLAVTATYDLFKLKMLPEMRRVFCELLRREGWAFQASDRVITDGKTRIILRSANAPGGLESATAKAAWLDECGQDDFRLDSWEAVQRRLSLARGRVLGTTTPYNMGWLKTEVYDRWRRGDPDYLVVQFASIMNPTFPRDEYDRAKATLPKWKFEMFYNGEFSRPAGMIYEDFDEVENVCDDFPIPGSWPRYVGFDFGPVHMASIWLAKDPDTGVYYLYRETLEGGMTTKQHAVKARERAAGENVVRWTGGAGSEDQYRRDFSENGVNILEPSIKEVDLGIDRVIGLIKPRLLKVFRGCKGTLDEIGIYSRKLDDNGQPTDEIKDKNNFHLLDALRYDAVGITAGPWFMS